MIDGWEKGWLKARRRMIRGRRDITAPCYQLVLCLQEGGTVTLSEGSTPFWLMNALLLPPDKPVVLESAEGTACLIVRFDRAALMTSCLPALAGEVLDLARHLATATPIEPGVYDVITDSSVTGYEPNPSNYYFMDANMDLIQ